jgi:hypothetical protein
MSVSTKAHYFDVITRYIGINWDKDERLSEAFAERLADSLREWKEIMDMLNLHGDKLGFKPGTPNIESLERLLEQLVEKGITLEKMSECPT